LMMPTLAVTTAHALVLTVSHDLLFRQPPFTATALLPPLLSNSPHCIGQPRAARTLCLVPGHDFPIHQLDKSHFIGKLPAEFQCYSRRAPMTCALNP
jgi:hypothetical protein